MKSEDGEGENEQILFDFGARFIGTVHTKEMEIVNKTSCGSYWKIGVETTPALKNPRKLDDGVFKITPASGYLGPFLADEKAANKQLIEISFTSGSQDYVEKEYCIKGKFGEDPIFFKVCGSGSQDGHFEQAD